MTNLALFASLEKKGPGEKSACEPGSQVPAYYAGLITRFSVKQTNNVSIGVR